MKFGQLIHAINQAHVSLQSSAVKAVNKHLTFRNWLIGITLLSLSKMVKTGLHMDQGVEKKLLKKSR
jgi:hypothetical protein